MVDARAGVGSPGYAAAVGITEVNFGQGWEDPEKYPTLDLPRHEQTIMDRLIELSQEDLPPEPEEYFEIPDNPIMG